MKREFYLVVILGRPQAKALTHQDSRAFKEVMR